MKLHYRIIGEGNPVLLLHGLFGMSDNLQSFGRQLAEKTSETMDNLLTIPPIPIN